MYYESPCVPVLVIFLFSPASFCRLHRMTSVEREEKEKVKKREKKLEDEETMQQATWVKYTFPIKHQVLHNIYYLTVHTFNLKCIQAMHFIRKSAFPRNEPLGLVLLTLCWIRIQKGVCPTSSDFCLNIICRCGSRRVRSTGWPGMEAGAGSVKHTFIVSSRSYLETPTSTTEKHLRVCYLHLQSTKIKFTGFFLVW